MGDDDDYYYHCLVMVMRDSLLHSFFKTDRWESRQLSELLLIGLFAGVSGWLRFWDKKFEIGGNNDVLLE